MATDKTKVQRMLQVMKSTNQVLVSLPAFYFAYMGFNNLGWITYTNNITFLYEAAAYTLALLWLEVLVIAIYLVITTAMKVIRDQ